MHAIHYNFVLLGFLCVRDTGHRGNKITVHMKPVYTVVVLPKMCDEFLIGWLSLSSLQTVLTSVGVTLQSYSHTRSILSQWSLLMQCAKKVVSDSPGLVDFFIRLVNSVLNLPDGQVTFFEEIQITQEL